MDLLLVLQNSPGSGLLWCGVSGRQLGKLAPNASISIELTLLATKPGLQVLLRFHLLVNVKSYRTQHITD